MPLLSIDEVSKIEGNRYSLPRLNLQLHEKDFVVIKTTNDYLDCLIHLLEGRLDRLEGRIEIYDKKINVIHNDDGIYRRDNVASYISFFNKLSSHPLRKSQVNELFHIAGLLNKKKKKTGSLNILEKQCLHLIRAVSLNPGVIVLKNPLQILNPSDIIIYCDLIKFIVREYDVAILLLTNNLEDALTLNVFTYIYDQIGLRPFDSGVLVEEDEIEKSERKLKKQSESKSEEHSKTNEISKLKERNQMEESELRKEAKEPREPKEEKEPKEGNEVTRIERTIIIPPIMKISCRYEDKLLLFNPNEIDYAESVEGDTYINVNGKAFQATMTLTQLEERLRDYGFFRCHRSYLINTQKIREIISYSRGSYVLKLSNYENSQIPLSRQKMEEMKELLHI